MRITEMDLEGAMLLRSIRALIISSVLCASGAIAAEETGQSLHDDYCTICHDSGHYTRDNRKMKSKQQLDAQVSRCQTNVAAEWNAEQTQSVADYLNETYYKFPAVPDK